MNNEQSMFCNQCEMSAVNGCGSNGQHKGTCGKNSTLSSMQDTMVYGLKGLSAYREHANELGVNTKEIDDTIAQTLYFTLTNVNFNFYEHVSQLMRVGNAGVKVMELLSNAHAKKFGIPTPVDISQNKAEGKAILVSGHNLDMLSKLLEATKDKGINIYTHSEMLPAHGYPELRKYSHLKGNIGKAWFDQAKLFEDWKGAIVVNTNCIVPPRKNCGYIDRIFTYKITGIDGAAKIENDDFSALIQKTLSLPNVDNFNEKTTLKTGHNYRTILSLAPEILKAISDKKIKRFFVIAGCDAPGKSREYYRELAISLPKDCVILTSSCGKFRFNDIDFGEIEGTNIPRYLDLGQCNDSNGAVNIAIALSDALNIPINELPVSIILIWMEQKAIIILLALLSLGIQNIHVGPKVPEFFNDEALDFLVENFNLSLIGNAKDDLKKFLG